MNDNLKKALIAAVLAALAVYYPAFGPIRAVIVDWFPQSQMSDLSTNTVSEALP